MLTGHDTVPAALAATTWRNRALPAFDGARWGEVAARVRCLALGLATLPGEVVSRPASTAGALAVLSVGGVIDFDAAPEALDEDALLAAGRALDERDADAYERRWQAVAPGDGAARGDGGETWTHSGLLWAARSVAQAFEVDAGDRISLTAVAETDGVDGVRAFVLRALVPVLTGASLDSDRPHVLVWGAAEATDASRHAVSSLPMANGPLGALRNRRAAVAAPAFIGLDACRLALVTGEADVAVDWLVELGVRAEPLVALPGCAVPVCAARPLPGVTVAIADDGEVLVRSDAVGLGRCAADGWLHSGRQGSLVGERLRLAR